MNISIELLNSILQYLGSRPYVEVADFITKIQAEAQADVAAKAVVDLPEETLEA
jgi:hypothetical protein